MQRIESGARNGWEQLVARHGLRTPCRADGSLPWDEHAHWLFTADEIETLYEAANELYAMCLDAAATIVAEKRWPLIGIGEAHGRAIARSWETRETDELSLTGRLEIAWAGPNAGDGQPKLLGFNADTPDGLLEASLVQWHWKEDRHPADDQFNGLHEALVAKLGKARNLLTRRWMEPKLHTTCRQDDPAARAQMDYLATLAREAGLAAEFIALPDIGYDHDARRFVDLADRPIALMAKHHPWQWLLRDPFGEALLEAVAADHLEVIEPAWRLVLSNKAILEVLWERYPFHPNLARAERDWRAFPEGTPVTAKPRFGLNAGGVGQGTVAGGSFGGPVTTEGFGEEGYVYQQTVPLAEAAGRHAVFDVWIVNGEAMGMGIRESASQIIDRSASFVPHRFTP